MFVLRLFGGVSLHDETGVLAGPAAQRHRLALLALLATARPRGLSRDKLMGYLWPERDVEHARRLLNQSVHTLRKALGEDALLSAGEDLHLDLRRVQTDVARFEEALANSDAAAAVALYRGSFLDGFFLNAAPEFEQWATLERARFADLHAGALEALAEQAEANGDFSEAVERWKARATADPYDSRVALRLMRAFEAAGNRAAALQHAAVHRQLLQQEFGVEPPADIALLIERLRGESGAVAQAGEERSPAEAVAAGPPPPDGHPDTARVAGTESKPPGRGSRPARRYALAVLAPAVALAAVFGASRLLRSEAASPPPAEPSPDERSIAVLPLANLSGDPAEAWRAAGMTEELTAMLARTGELRVIAGTSAAVFGGRQADVRLIADSLRVSHVLEGGLQRIGSRLRVTVRLVAARTGTTLWSETYDRELRDVFAVQEEIARSVSRELGLRLAGAADTPLRRPQTRSVAAYEHYLRGNDPVLLRSDEGALEGLEHFRQAIALDSTYAAAWAGMARMYSRVSATSDSFHERMALAVAAARRAVALDDSVAEAHATLGVVLMGSFAFDSAGIRLERALALDPTQARTREWLATLHLWKGRPEAALAEATRALEIDPLSPAANAEVARALLANGRCDEALAQLDRIAGLQPPLLRAAPIAAQCYALRGMWQEAIAVLRPNLERGGPLYLSLLGYMHARAGETEEALRILGILEERRQRLGVGAGDLAVVYAGLRDLDQTFLWLERAIDDGSLRALPGSTMLIEPLFDDVRRDPRFAHIRQRLGL